MDTALTIRKNKQKSTIKFTLNHKKLEHPLERERNKKMCSTLFYS